MIPGHAAAPPVGAPIDQDIVLNIEPVVLDPTEALDSTVPTESLSRSVAYSIIETGGSWVKQKVVNGVCSASNRIWGWCRAGGQLARRAASGVARAYTSIPTPVRVGLETVAMTGAMVYAGVPPLAAFQVTGAVQTTVGAIQGDRTRALGGVATMTAAAALPAAVTAAAGNGAATVAGAIGGAAVHAASAAASGVGQVVGTAATIGAAVAPTTLLVGAAAAATAGAGAFFYYREPIRQAHQVVNELTEALNDIDISQYQLSPPPFDKSPDVTAEQLRINQKNLWDQISGNTSLYAALFAGAFVGTSAVDSDDIMDCFKAAAAGYQSWDGWRVEQNRHRDASIPMPQKIAGWESLSSTQRSEQMFDRAQNLMQQMLEHKYHVGWAKRQMSRVTLIAARAAIGRILDRFSEKLLPSLQKLHSPEGAVQAIQVLQILVTAVADKIMHHHDVAQAIADGEQFIDEVSGAIIAGNVQEVLERALAGSAFNHGISATERERLSREYLLQDWLPDPFKPSTAIEGRLRPHFHGPWWQQLGQALLYLFLLPWLAIGWVLCRGLELIVNPILRRVINRQLEKNHVLEKGLTAVKDLLAPGIERQTGEDRSTQMGVAMTRGMTSMMKIISWKLYELAENPPSIKALKNRKAKPSRLSPAMQADAKRLVKGLLQTLPIQQAQSPEELRTALDRSHNVESLGPAAQFLRNYLNISADQEMEKALVDHAGSILEAVVEFILEDESLLLTGVNKGLESIASVFDPSVPEPTEEQVRAVDLEFHSALANAQKQAGSLISTLVLRNPACEQRKELNLLAQFTERPSSLLEQFEEAPHLNSALEHLQTVVRDVADGRDVQTAIHVAQENLGETSMIYATELANASDLLDALRALPADGFLTAEAADVEPKPIKYMLERFKKLLNHIGAHREATSLEKSIRKLTPTPIATLIPQLEAVRQKIASIANLPNLLAQVGADHSTLAIEETVESLKDWIQTAQNEKNELVLELSQKWLNRHQAYRLSPLGEELSQALTSELASDDPRGAELQALLSGFHRSMGQLNMFTKATMVASSLENNLDRIEHLANELRDLREPTATLSENHLTLIQMIENATSDISRLTAFKESFLAQELNLSDAERSQHRRDLDALSAKRRQLSKLVSSLQAAARNYTPMQAEVIQFQERIDLLSSELVDYLITRAPAADRVKLHQLHLISSCLRTLPLSPQAQDLLGNLPEWQSLVYPPKNAGLPNNPRDLFDRLTNSAVWQGLELQTEAQEQIHRLNAALAQPFVMNGRPAAAIARTTLLNRLHAMANERPNSYWKNPSEKWAQALITSLESPATLSWSEAQQSLSNLQALTTQQAALFRTQRGNVTRGQAALRRISEKLIRSATESRALIRRIASTEERSDQGFSQMSRALSQKLIADNERLQNLVSSLPEPGQHIYEREYLGGLAFRDLPANTFFKILARRLSPKGSSHEVKMQNLHRTLFGVMSATVAEVAKRKILPVLGIAHNRALISAGLDTGLTLIAGYQAERTDQAPRPAPFAREALANVRRQGQVELHA